MSTADLAFLTAEQLARAYRRRALSPVEVVEALLARSEALNPGLHAFLTVDPEGALAAARQAEQAFRTEGRQPTLCGIPVAVKDLFWTRGLRTTAGSLIYRDFVPDQDSVVVERLRRAGAVILGKTNTSEFALSATTENRLGEACRTPWDPTRTSGGSSGGSAAAVAAGLGPLAIGSDGGGSIRIPAAFCGVFGLKPTYGRVPRDGFGAMPLFSHLGPIARTVADAALLLDVLAGPDPRDPTALLDSPPGLYARLQPAGPIGPSAQPVVGWCSTPEGRPVDPEVARLVAGAVEAFPALGFAVEEAWPPVEGWFDLFSPIVVADEYVAEGELLAAHGDLMTRYARRTLEAGGQLPAHVYSRALRGLERYCYELRAFFARYDLLLTPATATPPFAVEERPIAIAGQPVDRLWGAFPFTAPFNLTGQPAAAIPVGLTASGLPVALQVVGRCGDELGVLRACAAFEQARGPLGTLSTER